MFGKQIAFHQRACPQPIGRAKKMLESIGDDVGSILECFQDLEDPRSAVNRKHLLGDLIVIAICAVIAGADGPKAIGVWAVPNRDWLKQHLELPNGIPSHGTIGRLLTLLKPAAFQTCFQNWIRTLRTDDEPTAGETASGKQEVIAIATDVVSIAPRWLGNASLIPKGATATHIGIRPSYVTILNNQWRYVNAVVSIKSTGYAGEYPGHI